MKRTFFALLVSVSAFAQAPVVQSITPDKGPESGGTEVVIRGINLGMQVACIRPCPPRVGFGDVFVDATEVSDQQLRVTTPVHPSGVVDVTIAIPGRPTVILEDAFTFLDDIESPYEAVLLPLYFPGTLPGAFDTQWATDLWIHNGGSESVSIADRVCPASTPCPPVIPLTVGLGAGHSLHDPTEFFRPARTNPSQILYISNDGAKDVSFGLRVADTSRHALNGGTDLPVIREGELLTRTAQLHNVPLENSTFRILLRVYDMSYSEAQFAVRFYPATHDDPKPSIYSLTLTAKTPRQGPFRAEAAYAELDIAHLLSLRLAWPQVARIEIEPLTPGSRYWAFVSLTNNETQLVTLITPQ
jgi:hypothetical protein